MRAWCGARSGTGFNGITHTHTRRSVAWRNNQMASAPRWATSTLASHALAEFSSDVLVGLGQPGQKELPSKYLYDEVGSALFDVICLLPEYGLSRAGMRSLKRYAPDIIDCLSGSFVVAEIGR